MVAAHVFIGPSGRCLPPAAFPRGVQRHGPIQHGDLLRLDPKAGDVVGIVDGLFYDRPAIRHKEILMAAASGVRIIGGSSIGALRAADLAGYGMEGIGRVYSWLSCGVVVADHEVAVLHGDEESAYHPITVALVSLRDVLEELEKTGEVSADQTQGVLKTVGGMYFADRTMDAVRQACAAARILPSAYAAIRETVEGERDVKVRDAVEVIAAVAAARHEAMTPPQTVDASAGEASDSYHLWVREVALDETVSPALANARAVQALQLLCEEMPAIYREAVVRRLAMEWGVAPTPEAIAEMFTRKTGVAIVDAAYSRHWLYPATPRHRDEDLCRLAVATYRVNPSLPAWDALLDLLHEHGALDEVAPLLSQTAPVTPVNPAPDTVLPWVGRVWGCGEDPDVLRRVGYMRGFRDVKEIYRTAARFLVGSIDPGSAARITKFRLGRLAGGIAR